MNITINPVELASKLAHTRTKDEMLFETNLIETENDMYITIEDKQENRYTDEAQEVFNRWYDYYYEIISGCEEK